MKEAIFTLSNGYFLHIQQSEQADYEYTIFDENKYLVDGGFWDSTDDLQHAAEEIANDNSLYTESLFTSDFNADYEDLYNTFVF